jgi:hypothetical protein
MSPQTALPLLFFLWRCDPTWVMASSFLRLLDHTQRRTTFGMTPLNVWSARRRDLYLTTHNTHNRQTSMPPGGIWTHDLSRQAAPELRLRWRGHWDRRINTTTLLKSLSRYPSIYVSDVLLNSFLESFSAIFSTSYKFYGTTASSGPGSPHCRGLTTTFRHTTLSRTPLDERSARHRDLYLTTHNIHKRETAMRPATFEPLIPAKRAAADARLRPRGHWDLPTLHTKPNLTFLISIN